MDDQERNEKFQRCVEFIQNLPTEGEEITFSPTNDQKLAFYSLYKQATIGPCNVPKPPMYQVTERYKWTAWSKLGNMSSQAAKEQYIQLLQDACEQFDQPEARILIQYLKSSSHTAADLYKRRLTDDIVDVLRSPAQTPDVVDVHDDDVCTQHEAGDEEDEEEEEKEESVGNNDNKGQGVSQSQPAVMIESYAAAEQDRMKEQYTTEATMRETHTDFRDAVGNEHATDGSLMGHSFVKLMDSSQPLSGGEAARGEPSMKPSVSARATPSMQRRKSSLAYNPDLVPEAASQILSESLKSLQQPNAFDQAEALLRMANEDDGDVLRSEEVQRRLLQEIENLKTSLDREALRMARLEEATTRMTAGTADVRREMKEFGTADGAALKNDLQALLQQVETRIQVMQAKRVLSRDAMLQRVEQLEKQQEAMQRDFNHMQTNMGRWSYFTTAIIAVPAFALFTYFCCSSLMPKSTKRKLRFLAC